MSKKEVAIEDVQKEKERLIGLRNELVNGRLYELEKRIDQTEIDIKFLEENGAEPEFIEFGKALIEKMEMRRKEVKEERRNISQVVSAYRKMIRSYNKTKEETPEVEMKVFELSSEQ